MQDGDRLLVSGSLPQLGNWQQNQPLMLSEVQTPHWEAEVRRSTPCKRAATFYGTKKQRRSWLTCTRLRQVSVPRKSFPITYKYGLQRKGGDMELEARPQSPPRSSS